VDQRFDQIDQRFDQVDQRFDQVDKRFAQIDQRFVQVDKRFAQIDQRFVQVDQGFHQIDGRLEQLTADVASLITETVDLRRHMGVLHEDVVDRIRGVGENDSLRQEMRAGFAMMMKRFDDHAIPGDAADRAFAAALADHEKRITALERESS
jgi:chromosome segregation ATPase